jgi:hypothetical protein
MNATGTNACLDFISLDGGTFNVECDTSIRRPMTLPIVRAPLRMP